MLRALRSLTLTSLAVLVTSIGCGGGGGGDDGGGATTDSSAFAAAYCALLAPCCAAAGLPVTDQQGCKLVFGSVPVADASAVQPCLDAYREQAKSPDFCGLQLPQPEACKRAFPQQGPNKGAQQPGQPCKSISDCAGSAMGLVTCDSVCQVMTHAASGAACSASVDGTFVISNGSASGASAAACYREDGVTCEDAVCKQISAVGGPCSGDSTCADGAYCAKGTCAARLPPGSSCADTPSACDAASYCDRPSNGTCKPLQAEGAACETNSQCTTGYCYPDRCAKRGAGLALLTYCQ